MNMGAPNDKQIKTTRRSTESYGVGQSGFTAGRHEGDLALERELLPRNLRAPGHEDPPLPGTTDLDERWTGRGGVAWTPEEDPDAGLSRSS